MSLQVTRQVAQCKCAKRFQVEQIGENKYRVSLWVRFGPDSGLHQNKAPESNCFYRKAQINVVNLEVVKGQKVTEKNHIKTTNIQTFYWDFIGLTKLKEFYSYPFYSDAPK